MKFLTRTIWILSLVSLFTDVASEMLYPVMPIFLNSIGFSVLLIGILEGLAEATAGFSKGFFGKLSDAKNRRAPFVVSGYALSAISKPLLAVTVYPLWILFARTLDRLGKGIRTGARDAMLSGESRPENKGKVFGFHRGMDTLGAVIGPLAALIYLNYYPGDYKTLFLIAFLPGIFSIGISLLLKDKNRAETTIREKTSIFSFIGYWKVSPAAYRKVVAGLLVFALFNSSDVFLLLKLKQSGLGDTYIIGIYIFYNLIYALTSFPAGWLADKIGLKKMFVFGLFIFAVVYSGMGVFSELNIFIIIFILYGIYASATEGISKALITNISSEKDSATAIGFYTGFQSICTLLASTLAGAVWYGFGPQVLFIGTAICAFVIMLYFFAINTKLNET
jgi:MFS family permease